MNWTTKKLPSKSCRSTTILNSHVRISTNFLSVTWQERVSQELSKPPLVWNTSKRPVTNSMTRHLKTVTEANETKQKQQPFKQREGQERFCSMQKAWQCPSWKDCPKNWHNKNHPTTSNDIPIASNASLTWSRSSKGKVKSMEHEEVQSKHDPTIVIFEDIKSDVKSVKGSVKSWGEQTHVIARSSKKESLHPISIPTLRNKEQQRVAYRALLD